MGVILFSFLLTAIIVIIAKSKERQQNEEHERQKLQEENEKQKKRERFEAFCILHPEIEPLAKTVDKDIDTLIRTKLRTLIVNPMPTPPRYTRGLYEGSLADNVSVLSNAEKKSQYEKALDTYQKNEIKIFEAKIESKNIARRCYNEILVLIDALEKIPESQEFLEDAIKQRDYVKSEME